MNVYIAGPYTNPDPVTNTTDAILAGDTVALAGHIPFIPHLFMTWHMLFAHDYEFWMKMSSAWLDKCDALIRLPGDSAGSDREIDQARELGIPIYYGVDNFLAHNPEEVTIKEDRVTTLGAVDWGFQASVSFCCPHCGGSIAMDLETP